MMTTKDRRIAALEAGLNKSTHKNKKNKNRRKLMKNKKYSKILVAALSLALLLGAAIGIAASAENAENTPEILGKNIQYGADLKFMVAIDPASVGGNDKTVTLSVYEGDPANGGKLIGQPATALYTDVTSTNLNVDYAYVATSTYGISALAYNENYYLVVECDGDKTVTQYSAVEYFLERLYADDVINKTDEESLVQKELYESAIAYGSAAQKMAKLENKYDGANVADYLYVMAKDGKVNGADGVVVLKGDALNFTYTGTEDPSGVAYWLDPAGNKATVATASGLYAAKFADYTFGDLSNDTVITASNLTSWQKVTGWVDGDKDTSKYNNFLLNDNITNHGTYSYSIVDGKLKYTSSGYTRFGFGQASNPGNHTVYEADITITVPEGQKRTITMTYRYGTALSSSTAMYEGILSYESTTGKVVTYFQRNNGYKNSSTTGDGIANTTRQLQTQVANAGDTTATFRFKVESFYIAETYDTALVLSINDEVKWILDSRGVDRSSPPASDDLVWGYQNTDGVWVSQYAFTEASKTDYSPRKNVFGIVTFAPNNKNDCELLFDNITLTYDDATAPVYNLERK